MTNATQFNPIPGAEDVDYYCLGGFHPVHLNDTFKEGRYQVVHKLGYGAYSTVWLVYDTILKRYSSLKILAAEVSDSNPEVIVLQHLQQHGTGSGKEYVVDVFDLFKHSGPNGVHQCIVMEILGPCIPIDGSVSNGSYDPSFPASDTSSVLSDSSSVLSDSSSVLTDTFQVGVYSLDVAKRMSAQITRGLAYIHKAGIVHGDLHVGNILLHSPAIASWSSKSDIEMYLGTPSLAQVRSWESGELTPPSRHMPSYIVRAPNHSNLMKLCMLKSQVHVKICDFSEAFIPTIHLNPPPRNTPVVYASPELIFDDLTGKPADIWALAVLLHCIISRYPLFPSDYGIREDVLQEMVLKLGKLPDKWWYKYEERGDYFNEDGKWIGNRNQTYSGSNKLMFAIKDMNKAEFSAYKRLTRRMVTYDPEERASIDEVIEWMNQNKWVC